jgi:hypothetical protein
MRMPIHIPVTIRCAACALALTLAACPDGTGPTSVTSTIDFEALAPGEQVAAQYRGPAGVQFVTAPASCGLVCSVPPGERWTIPCEALPTVVEYAAAPSGRHVASLRAGSGDFTSNTVCARLDRPAGLVSIRVRDLSGANEYVTIVAVDAAGEEIDSEEWSLDPAGFAMPRIIAPDDDMAGFAVYGERGARLIIDNVWITRPR